MKKETETKIAIYGTNFAAGVFDWFILDIPGIGIGNLAGSLVYSALDIASNLSEKVKSSRYTRFA